MVIIRKLEYWLAGVEYPSAFLAGKRGFVLSSCTCLCPTLASAPISSARHVEAGALDGVGGDGDVLLGLTHLIDGFGKTLEEKACPTFPTTPTVAVN